jgi:NAD(P)-dependent dehydrogenase (short-subunit alcohol dehydrogenase family)
MADADRVAIVTGGSAGIGRAAVLALAASGYAVGLTYRSRSNDAAALTRSITTEGGRASARFLDLEDPSSVPPVITDLIQDLGGIDVLVNNAGVNRRRQALAESLEQWTRVLETNLTGPFLCAQTAAREMIARGCGGRIINVSSVLAHAPVAGGAAYCASKAGLELLTRVLALELGEHGILVNCVAPGHTATAMNYPGGKPPPRLPAIPIGRAASPEEIASVIRFLASAPAGYLTGSSVLVDGGLLLVAGPTVLEAPRSEEVVPAARLAEERPS